MIIKEKNVKEYCFKIIVLILLIAIFIVVLSIVNMLKQDSSLEEENIDEKAIVALGQVQMKSDLTELEKLKNMPERNRIEQYIKKFISYAIDGEYEKAYRLLNIEYRKNYFPTEDSFKEYAQNLFTKMVDVQFTNFERNGEIYVSWLTLTDAINGSKDSGTEFNFVVKENDFNDFELSFSKK